jgi:dethiobiotin synthetase
MSPITYDALNLDLIKMLRCPAILVTGSYLGALNHTLTALEALKTHKVDVKAVILNENAESTVRFEATLDSLRRFAPTHAITTLRRGARSVDLGLLAT